MSHPTIAPDSLDRLGPDLLAGGSQDVARAVKWVGASPEVDLSALDRLIPVLEAELEAFVSSEEASDKDLFEGRAAEKLHRALAHLPIDVLDNPGFWRFVSVAKLWWLARWREQVTHDKGEWEKFRVYVDGRRSSECVALRMFIRGRIAAEAGDPSLAHAVPQATDLWRSHIVRVRTSYIPTLAGELLKHQVGDRRMPTNDLREFAKRLNRLASNVVIDTYDASEVDPLLEELRP